MSRPAARWALGGVWRQTVRRRAGREWRTLEEDAVWEAILVDGWGPLVRHAVVERVERATLGSRGTLVRALADPDHARFAWTEWLHCQVVDAIMHETGADLDALGSQAAWACYEDAWELLAARWRDGGRLGRVASDAVPRLRTLLAHAPAWVAERAGADIGGIPPEPLVLHGVTRIDLEGLTSCLRSPDLDERGRRIVDAMIGCADVS